MRKSLLLFCFVCLLFTNLHSTGYQLIDSPYPGDQIEIFVQKPEQDQFELLVFLHGASGKGIEGISEEWFDHWTGKGYAVASISMRGFGRSTGKKDFCGPKTLQSLNFALDVIKKQLNVCDFGMIAFGQGGLAGTLLCAQREDIRCLVSTNGIVDLANHLGIADPIRINLERKGYDIDLIDQESLKVRSPFTYIEEINTPMLLFVRGGHPQHIEEEAKDFWQQMTAANKLCGLMVLYNFSSNDPAGKLTYEEVLEEAEEWVDERMELSS